MISIFNLSTWKNFYGIDKKTALGILFIPIAVILIQILLFIIPNTQDFAFWLLDENAPVETLTFISAMAGGIYGIYTTKKLFLKIPKFVSLFYLVFSTCLILVAMEEIAWGQWFFHFKTPEAWENINLQGETTLHNIKGLHGHMEILRLLFGFGGLIGMLFLSIPVFEKISVPVILLPWFLIIFGHSLLDVLTTMDNNNHPVQRISEIIELFITCSATLYIWLNFCKIKLDLISTQTMN